MTPRWSFVLASLALVACSSSGGGSSSTTDAGVGPDQPAGGACDPTLAQPCTVSADVCTLLACDPKSRRCVLAASDAGGCGLPSSTCTTDVDCGGGTCVQGLCYQSCLSVNDCDAGACTTFCPGDATSQGCKGYCTR